MSEEKHVDPIFFVKGASTDRLSVKEAECEPGHPGADGILPEPQENGPSDNWLARFHAGERRVIEQCYREHFNTVAAAARPLVDGADHENVVHEVFFLLVSNERVRRGFRGGALGSWLWRVTRNRAIDYLRRQQRERGRVADGTDPADLPRAEEACHERRAHWNSLIVAFRAELPEGLIPVFEARFIHQLTQPEAAGRLRMRRTTLAYQEHKIRKLLQRFMQRSEEV